MWIKEVISVLKHIKDYPFGLLGDKIEIRDSHSIDTPLVLVHGFLSNKSIWRNIKERLTLLGWTNIHCFNYHVYASSVAEISTNFSRFVDEVVWKYGEEQKVCMIGHSLGGVIIRDWVTTYSNHKYVDSVITIGSPHLGTKVAHIGKLIPFKTRKLIADIVPNSMYLNTLNSRTNIGDVRWGAIYSTSDELIFPKKNALYPPHYEAEVFEVNKVGHVTLVYSVGTTLICHKFLVGGNEHE